MSTEEEQQVYETARDALSELMGPIYSPVEAMTDWPGGQVTALREISAACSPRTHEAAMRRLCEKLEQLVDGAVSGSVLKMVEQDIYRLSAALEDLRKSSTDLAEFLEPYTGFRGTLRLALETGTKPWNLLSSLVGKDPFQMRRTELENRQQVVLDQFGDATLALILALESALSRHFGKHFRFRESFGRRTSTEAANPTN